MKAIPSGVYHSRYDTFEHHSRFVDPGFVYDALLAKTVGRLVLRAADADLPIQRADDFAGEISLYATEVKKLADDKREAAEIQSGCCATISLRSPPIPPNRTAIRPH